MELQSRFIIYKDQLFEFRYDKFIVTSDIYVLNKNLEFEYLRGINTSSKIDLKMIYSNYITDINVFRAYTNYLKAKDTARSKKYLRWFKNNPELLI